MFVIDFCNLLSPLLGPNPTVSACLLNTYPSPQVYRRLRGAQHPAGSFEIGDGIFKKEFLNSFKYAKPLSLTPCPRLSRILVSTGKAQFLDRSAESFYAENGIKLGGASKLFK